MGVYFWKMRKQIMQSEDICQSSIIKLHVCLSCWHTCRVNVVVFINVEKKWGHFVSPRLSISKTSHRACVSVCLLVHILHVRMCVSLFSLCVCVCLSVIAWVCVNEQGTHWSAWQVFGTAFDIIEKIYSSRSPDDKRLAAEQIPFQTYSFTGSKLSFELLAAAGRLVHTRSWEEREVYLFYFTVERVVDSGREERKEKGNEDRERRWGLGKVDETLANLLPRFSCIVMVTSRVFRYWI